MRTISCDSLTDLPSRESGLTEAEVSAQRARHGSNDIVEMTRHPWLEIALDTARDPMIWFLLGIGLVFLLVDNKSDAIILFVAMLPLVLMDAVLHWRTQASTASLQGQLMSTVTVIRETGETTLDYRDLVPGDLVRVVPGLFLPADGLFQKATDVQIDESVLTGEAFPIPKRPSPLNPFLLAGKGDTSIDANTVGYAGTRVLTGTGTLRVLFTGARTQYGDIVHSLATVAHERTPLQKSITTLVQGLVLASTVMCLLLAGVRMAQGHGWLDALLSAAALAIAAIPEEFPVVFAFFLGVGVYRLAQRHALVRRAVSVENIGRVTQICTDKTGTITRGLLRLTHLDPREGLSETELLTAAFAASNPDATDPVDVAIRDIAAERTLAPHTRLRTFPFTEDRKQETAFVRTEDGRSLAYVKGAPETILAQSQLSDEARRHWSTRTAQWAREGHKVLACARTILTEEAVQQATEPTAGLEFCGLLAFEDPPRPEVAEAMAYCRRHGIGVLMITGDHMETALAIAKEIGLGGTSPIGASAEATPEQFEAAWLERHPAFLRGLQVVSRCTPAQKLRIVNALKASGELVAVTGDSVNNVPALQAADIGIAMGERGVRSAKEVSAIVLADDNFRTIVDAIKEGRQLFTNLRLSFTYLLLLHMPFVLTAAIIPLLGYPLLYLPVHIIWLELLIHPSALFAFQQKAAANHGSTPSQRAFFSRAEIQLMVLVGLLMTAALTADFATGLSAHTNIGHARAQAMALLTLWSAGLVAQLSRLRTWAAPVIVGTTLLSSILAIQVAPIAELLHLTPLPLSDWLVAAGAVIVCLAVKHIGRILMTRTSHAPAAPISI